MDSGKSKIEIREARQEDFKFVMDSMGVALNPFRQMLLDTLPKHIKGINSNWVDALFSGYRRHGSLDINLKYKLIYVAVDRSNTVLGVVGATPKKGEPIKIMPFVATTLPAFVVLITEMPNLLKPCGHKLYIHIVPSVEVTIALQQRAWRLDAAMPAAYHDDLVTQQRSLDIGGEYFMRLMRVKQRFLDLIKEGKKTLEVRINYDNIKTIQPGERIRLASRTETQVIRVRDVRGYSTLDEMMVVEKAECIAPGFSKQGILSLLKEIYPPEKERLGVIVLDIQIEK